MSIEADLRKDGIEIIEPLDNSSVISIAKNVSDKLYLAFPNAGFTAEELFEKFSKVTMYIAKIPDGMAEASYYYKNASIYFRDGMGLADLERYAIHELVHHFQERKDEKGNLARLGLCEFKGSKITGMALNEAAVQIIASNALNYTFENVEYYGLSFSTISTSLYPVLCNLVTQMAYVTGEEVLFDSTFNSNNRFKNKFIALCGEKNYNNILNSLDKILYCEEDIIKYNNLLQTKDLSFAKSERIMNKIESLKQEIKKEFLFVQETIITANFNTLYSTLLTTVEIENFRKNLYNYQELIGTTQNYFFFNNFYINMMEKLDHKFDVVTGSTYLIPKRKSKLAQLINFIKKLILKREFENEKE